MKLIELVAIGDLDTHMYIGHCVHCGEKHKLFTQADNNPEYYTTVRLICDCGHVVSFRLPVN